MSSAPVVEIDLNEFWADPYPTLSRLRAETPIAFVPQLNATLFARREDIFASEKNIGVFSSQQPNGLMNKIMGMNLMRKDGQAHKVERKAILPSMSPQAVKAHWFHIFSEIADRLLDELVPKKKRGSGGRIRPALFGRMPEGDDRPYPAILQGYRHVVAGHDRRDIEL